MDLQLKGKLALVSGGTAGIGYAIARTLAAEGAGVVRVKSKVRYRGLTKNATRAFVALGLANIHLARQRLMA